MCEYCGCRDIPLIGRLSEEHYEAVDGLGEVRRAIEAGNPDAVASALDAFAADLFEHNESEEAGLFRELAEDDYFAPTVAELIQQHGQIRTLVGRLATGDYAAYAPLEELLRRHVDREENGLFPATAVAVDGPTWERIDQLTHAFNHAHHREHGHTEAEARGLATASLTPGGARANAPVVSPTGGFEIRPALPSDAAALVALWAQTDIGDFAPDDIAHELASCARLHPQLLLVATTGDSVIGSLIGTFDGRRAWVNRLATRRDWRGRGVATALMHHLEDAVRALGGPKINLLIVADNYPVAGFYERLGYDTSDLIFMGKWL